MSCVQSHCAAPFLSTCDENSLNLRLGAEESQTMTTPDNQAARPTDSADAPPHPPMRRRDRLRRLNPAMKYVLLFVTLAVLVVVGELVLHGMNTEPRDSRVIADREMSVNVLAPDERVVSSISVFRRSAIDYLRATRGVLVLTNKRMVFLGLRPRDLLSPPDAPPTFDEEDFPLDTLVAVESGRAMAGLTKGIVVRTPNGTLRLGVPNTAWPEAEKLVALMTNRRTAAHSTGATKESMRKIADAEWKRAVAAWQKPQYYTVRRGDALGGIATQWNTTPGELQRLNKLPNNNIRIGQSLLVRDAM